MAKQFPNVFRPDHIAAAVAMAIWLVPSIALACGAFVPLDEFDGDLSAADTALTDLVGHDEEQMLYVVDDGQVTVYQGRTFTGNVDEFAWLLPIPGKPDIEMAPREIFAKLDEVTTPTFVLDDESDGDCPAEPKTLVETEQRSAGALGVLSAESPDMGGASLSAAPSNLPEVGVVDSGTVGPFDHTTITTREDVRRPGKRALQWLEDHGYALDAVDDALLDAYLEAGSNLLAFRLRADASKDEIRPVAITVDADQAMSPIRLGAMGAAERTDIRVWVAASNPVAPETYDQVQPNQALVNWADGGTNYDEVVAEAVREAGGQAFTVDATVETSKLDRLLMSPEDTRRWSDLRDRSVDSPSERRAQLLEVANLVDAFDEQDELDITGELHALREEFLPVPDDGFSVAVARTRGFRVAPDQQLPRSSDYYARRFHAALRSSLDFDDTIDCHTGIETEAGVARHRISGRVRTQITMEADQSIELNADGSSLNEEDTECVINHLQSALATKLDQTKVDFGLEKDQIEEIVFQTSIQFRDRSQPEDEVSTRQWIALLSDDELNDIDRQEFVQRVEDDLIAPRQRAQRRLASVDYLTRLSTVMSPDDMIRDVYFTEEPDAEPRPRKRRATRTILCGEDSEQRKEEIHGAEKRIYTTRDWHFDPPHGTPVEGHGSTWPLSPTDGNPVYTVVNADVDNPTSPPDRDSSPRTWIVALMITVVLSAVAAPVVMRWR